MRKRYVTSKRHTIQVDFDDYLHALAKERAQGPERARANGFEPPRPMPTFCRHNRFIDRCPICSKALAGNSPQGRANPRKASSSASTATTGARRGGGMRVHRQQRAVEDGYGSPLAPGLRASADATRLAEEIAFANGRLLGCSSPSGADPAAQTYATLRRRSPAGDPEQATWICFLTAYLCPLEGAEPFAGIRRALQVPTAASCRISRTIPLGPRTSHDPARGAARSTPTASGSPQSGSQELAFTGDPSWSAQRRFERLFERLALPGLTRAARYELLVLLGALGLYELRADSLHSRRARAAAPRTRRRSPPSACSRSAIRCCSTAARRRSPRRLGVAIELAGAGAGQLGRRRARHARLRRAGLRRRRRSIARATRSGSSAPDRRRMPAAAAPARSPDKERESAVLTAAYSAPCQCLQSPRESRCHFASSSHRTQFE